MSWSDLDSSYIGHVKFGGIPKVEKIASPGIVSPVKMMDLTDDLMVVLDRRVILNDEQSSITDMYAKVIVLKRQNSSSVHNAFGTPKLNSTMNLR